MSNQTKEQKIRQILSTLPIEFKPVDFDEHSFFLRYEDSVELAPRLYQLTDLWIKERFDEEYPGSIQSVESKSVAPDDEWTYITTIVWNQKPNKPRELQYMFEWSLGYAIDGGRPIRATPTSIVQIDEEGITELTFREDELYEIFQQFGDLVTDILSMDPEFPDSTYEIHYRTDNGMWDLEIVFAG